MDDVTFILDQLRATLGTGTPVTAPLPSAIPAQIRAQLDQLPNGQGKAIEALIQRRLSQQEILQKISSQDGKILQIDTEASTSSGAARKAVDGTKTIYESNDKILAPVAGTPAGQAAVYANKAGALNAGASAVTQTQQAAATRARLVDALTQEYVQQARSGGGSTGSGSGGSGSGGGIPSIPQVSVPQVPSTSLPTIPTSNTTSNSTTGDDTGDTGAGTGSTTEIPGVPAGGTEGGRRAAEAALKQLGLPYVWGGGNGNGPTGGGFDCSGLTSFAYQQGYGIALPRTTYDQINMGTQVDASQAQPGDLVFSNFSSPGVPEHVGLAIGNGQVVHAPTFGQDVQVSSLPSDAVVKRVPT